LSTVDCPWTVSYKNCYMNTTWKKQHHFQNSSHYFSKNLMVFS
jgi:hypothetical protein